jgi:hypothetical protein
LQARNQQQAHKKKTSACQMLLARFLFGLDIDPEYGGDMFLPTTSGLTLQPKKSYSLRDINVTLSSAKYCLKDIPHLLEYQRQIHEVLLELVIEIWNQLISPVHYN